MGVPAWLSIPAPIAIGGGTGGRQAPPAGVCPGFLEPSRAQREDVDIALMGGADTARGLLPPDPCMRLPLDVRVIGRAVWFSMRNSGWSCRRVLWVPAPIAGLRGSQPPGRCLPGLSGTLTCSARGCGYRSDGWSGYRPYLQAFSGGGEASGGKKVYPGERPYFFSTTSIPNFLALRSAIAWILAISSSFRPGLKRWRNRFWALRYSSTGFLFTIFFAFSSSPSTIS